MPTYVGSVRRYCAQKSDDGIGEGPPETGESIIHNLPATQSVPDIWPNVPVIAISYLFIVANVFSCQY